MSWFSDHIFIPLLYIILEDIIVQHDDALFLQLIVPAASTVPPEDQYKGTLHGGLERHAGGILGHGAVWDAAAASAALPDPSRHCRATKFHTHTRPVKNMRASN